MIPPLILETEADMTHRLTIEADDCGMVWFHDEPMGCGLTTFCIPLDKAALVAARLMAVAREARA